MTIQEQRRKDFEAWVPRTFALDTAFDDEGDIYYEDDWVQGAWIGWNAALNSVEIGLPDPRCDAQEIYLRAAEKAIEAAGLRVKP